jgi:hypothetical protein
MASNGRPVSKVELDTALTVLKSDLDTRLTGLKSDLDTRLTVFKDELIDAMRQIETNLLTEFHRYAKGQQVRLHSIESGAADLTLRLATIEERLLALEARRPPSI